MDDLLQGLNEAQQQAVTSTEGYIRVIAGAGSGKTKALTHRYGFIVNALGIEPSNMLCVTFTNKAAHEMRRRVKQLIGGERDTGFITTYHGFCVRVLREDIHRLFYPKNFVILDVEDQKTILREIFEDLGLKLNDKIFKRLLDKIGMLKGNTHYVQQMVQRGEMPAEEAGDDLDGRIIQMYLKKQKRVFGLDFDDLINFTFVLFSQYSEVLEKWQDRLFYIQVDEFQDSNAKQFELVRMLAEKHGNLFVVGDPDQTIYEWRGADPKYIVDFQEYFPSAETVYLNRNYRSTPEILSVGNSLIKHNYFRVDKEMVTDNAGGLKVIHYHGKDEQEEAAWVVDKIKELIDKKQASYNSIAILYRANYLSRFIEQTLIKESIEYTIFGGFKFFDRMEVKDALAHLRMVAFEDDLSFSRIINVPKRQIGKKRMQFLRERAEAEDLSLYDALKKYADHPRLHRTGAQSFIEAIESLKVKRKTLNISELLQEALQQTGYEAYIREDGDQDRLDNLTELLHSIVQYEQTLGEDIELEEYLQMLTLYTEHDREAQAETVKMMTIHTAKGLEFPYVFFIGMTEGIIPNVRTLRERKERGLEEERRLAYVAMTRAEKELYLTESEGFQSGGLQKYPSRFIFEIEEAAYQRIGLLDEELIKEAKRYIQAYAHPDQASVNGFHKGSRVRHPVFGEGKIESVDEKKNTYLIFFDKLKAPRPISRNFKNLEFMDDQ
ncbi:DNA helicase [Thalassobacillus devorans]|uniref:DNA 3'-5' helicase n=1 Tax=Thalassobacillus devorans TaxID=279813 RepID=A0ABQ1PQR6_9BACI|nr:UvrD-helicase domain-containing protein [Thalassobacillus devorans]NIK30596.1 DNA helicase-2/ATP-dependent DNA helicase PcrA [Thalassobacillus devorans]GGD01669.1 DNA helicase [Thalassobacillus devorans]